MDGLSYGQVTAHERHKCTVFNDNCFAFSEPLYFNELDLVQMCKFKQLTSTEALSRLIHPLHVPLPPAYTKRAFSARYGIRRDPNVQQTEAVDVTTCMPDITTRHSPRLAKKCAKLIARHPKVDCLVVFLALTADCIDVLNSWWQRIVARSCVWIEHDRVGAEVVDCQGAVWILHRKLRHSLVKRSFGVFERHFVWVRSR